MEIAPLLAMRGFPLSRSGGRNALAYTGGGIGEHPRQYVVQPLQGERAGTPSHLHAVFFIWISRRRCGSCWNSPLFLRQGLCNVSGRNKKQLRLPPKDSSEEQVRRYLTDIRKVSADVVGYFIETGQVYQSRAEGVRQGQEQCNLVLVGMDRDGAPRQAHIKGMRQRAFRYDAPGSDKAYGFRHMGGSGPLYVFEAAVDLMSYVSLYPKDWRQGNYLALNGTAETALFRTLEEYPEVRGVVLALDNDAGGIEGVMRLTGRLREKRIHGCFCTAFGMEGLERGLESARGDGCSVCTAAPETADAGTGKGCGLGAGSACAAFRGRAVSGGDISSGLFGTGG